MRQRVLFVDDDPLVLQGLRRMLYQMRCEWDMEFAESGARALELMAQHPCEIVVADMCMPGMSGAELLNQVLQRYPKTIRLLLTGHADQELILQCVGATHQYLAKPCDADTLKATVQRAAALERSLHSDAMRRLLAQVEHLPSLPALYLEIVEALRSPEVSLERVAAIIAKDIGLTASMLKLVNSAFFGLRHRIADPVEAVQYLGVDTVKSLVLSIHSFSQFQSTRVPGFSVDGLWRHSLQSAAAAKAVARFERADQTVVGEAFAAGLLHDAGKVVLAANFEREYQAILARTEPGGLSLLHAEEQAFGATHADVGGYLFGLWGLSVPLVEAVAFHHQPASGGTTGFSPLAAVRAANRLVHELADGAPREPAAGVETLSEGASAPDAREIGWRRVVRDALREEPCL